MAKRRKKSEISKITVQHKGKKITGINAVRIKAYKKSMVALGRKEYKKMSVTKIKNEAERMFASVFKEKPKVLKGGKFVVATKNIMEERVKIIDNWDITEYGTARQQATYQAMLAKTGTDIHSWMRERGVKDYNASNMTYIDSRGRERSWIETMEEELQ